MLPVHLQQTRPQTTAHLAQTMTLLAMTAVELAQTVESELAQNPALELEPPHTCPVCGRALLESGPCPLCSRPHAPDNLEPIIFSTARRDSPTYTPTAQPEDDLPEDNLPPAINLAAYVLRQIAPELAEEDRPLAAHILSSLDDDGLLPISLSEISRYHHVPLARVQRVQRLIQFADPLGVGSEDPQQALLIQLEALESNPTQARLAEKAIREGMDLLTQRQFARLGDLLGISSQEVEQLAAFIHNNLNPYPARAHWGSLRQGLNAVPAVYHQPDIVIQTLNSDESGPLVVEMVYPMRGLPRLHPLFIQEMRKAEPQKIEKWQHDIERAALLIKCLRQRENTLRRMMSILAIEQRNFILYGDHHLKSMTRAWLAEKLAVHESTISRAVSAKNVQLPNGRIIPLSKFFDRSLAIRARIRDLIAEERQPLSDAQIATLLRKQGYNIARRTVAKYRAMEGILPLHTRQKTSRSNR